MKLPAYQELSKEQDAINNLPLDESYLVTGPPGTGKTVMALYRAATLSKLRRQSHIIMYSNLLCRYIQTAQQYLELSGQVVTFHKWMYSFFREHYKTSAPEVDKYIFDWQRILPIIGNAPPAPTPSSILVDEGQDLPSEFYLLLPNIGQSYVIFADENQAIHETQSTIRKIQQYTRIPDTHLRLLKRNYRNTQEIALLAREFYTGLSTGIPDLPSRHGERPVMKRTQDLNDWLDWIARFYKIHSDLNIGVFTRKLELQNRIKAGLANRVKGSVQTYSHKDKHSLDFEELGIKLVTFQSAKGLEFDAVFIPELQDVNLDLQAPTTRSLLYVLISRARDALFLSYSGTCEPALLGLFPRHLME